MQTGERIHYIDNVRALTLITVIFFHTVILFRLHNPFITVEPTLFFEIVYCLLNFWMMPAMFLLAGAAAVNSLKKRDYFAFQRERFFRLMVPFLIGIPTVMLVNGYFTYQYWNGALGFFDYLPLFFEVKSLTGWEGQFSVGHLWFLGYLAGFSLVAPFIVRWATTNQSRFFEMDTGTAVAAQAPARLRPGLEWVVLGTFLGLLMVTLMTGLPYPNPLYFLIFFGFGILIFSVPGLVERVIRPLLVFLLPLGVIVPVASWMQISGQVEPGYATQFEPLWLYNMLHAATAFGIVIALLHLSHRRLNKRHEMLRWINDHGLWIYVLHMPFISIAGYFLDQTSLPVLVALVLTNLWTVLLTIPAAILALKLENRLRRRTPLPLQTAAD